LKIRPAIIGGRNEGQQREERKEGTLHPRPSTRAEEDEESEEHAQAA
jgi:hypothetical protein